MHAAEAEGRSGRCATVLQTLLSSCCQHIRLENKSLALPIFLQRAVRVGGKIPATIINHLV